MHIPFIPISKDQLINSQIRLPNICCRCGVQPGHISIRLRSMQSKVNHLIVITVVEQSTSTLNVLVCESCEETLHSIWLKNTIAAIGSMSFCFMLGIVGGLIGSWLSSGIWVLWVIGGITFSIFAGLALAFLLTNRLGLVLGTFDGNLFWFVNPIYLQQFRLLNPQLTANQPKRTRNALLVWR